MATVLPYLADFLVVFGVFVMTLGVIGVVRMPDAYTRLHAASKMVFLGIMPLLLASVLVGGLEMTPRAVLIAEVMPNWRNNYDHDGTQ